jgi:hypothetical protein
MLKVVDFKVRSLSYNANELQWGLEQESEDPLEFTFQVYRSEQPGGEFEAVSPVFVDKYYFIDNQLPQTNRWRYLYYQLKITDKNSNSEFLDYAFRGSAEGKYALEITRQEKMAFRRFAGTRVFVLPIRTFGRKCSCYDEVMKKALRPNCTECYGTRFSGGYHHAVETYAQMGTFKRTTRELPEAGAEIQPAANRIKLINYPIVKRGDLIIDPQNNNRWQVAGYTPTMLGGILIHQEVDASLVDPSKVQYKIRLDDFDIFSLNEPPNQVNRKTTI